MDFDVSWLGVLFSFVGMLFMVYAWRKTVGNREFFLDIFEDIVNEATTNEEVQKKLYLLGALVGNGLKSGLDLGNLMKSGGKLKIEDLIGLGIQRFFKIGPNQESEAPQKVSRGSKQIPQM